MDESSQKKGNVVTLAFQAKINQETINKAWLRKESISWEDIHLAAEPLKNKNEIYSHHTKREWFFLSSQR